MSINWCPDFAEVEKLPLNKWPLCELPTGRVPLSMDAIHGDRSQRDREAALQHFRSGATQVDKLLQNAMVGSYILNKQTRNILENSQKTNKTLIGLFFLFNKQTILIHFVVCSDLRIDSWVRLQAHPIWS